MRKLNQKERRCVHRKRLERDDEDCSRLESRGLISKRKEMKGLRMESKMKFRVELDLRLEVFRLFCFDFLLRFHFPPSGVAQANIGPPPVPSTTLSFERSVRLLTSISSCIADSFTLQSHSDQRRRQRPNGNFHPPTLIVIVIRMK